MCPICAFADQMDKQPKPEEMISQAWYFATAVIFWYTVAKTNFLQLN